MTKQPKEVNVAVLGANSAGQTKSLPSRPTDRQSMETESSNSKESDGNARLEDTDLQSEELQERESDRATFITPAFTKPRKFQIEIGNNMKVLRWGSK